MRAKREFHRIMAGHKSAYAETCFTYGFIGGNWEIHQDLSQDLPEDWREFNHKFIPIFLKNHPEKSKITAGLACGMLHTICKGIQIGDIILTPNGKNDYYHGEVISEYYYVNNEILPHRRKVRWSEELLNTEEFSQALKSSIRSSATVCNMTKHWEELEALLTGKNSSGLFHKDETVEDPAIFALEKHLEDFLVANWSNTSLGKDYNIYSDDEGNGQQYPSDTGPIDILAISKDKKTLLVVELKKGRASDVVVGQIQRYMGYVKSELAETNQNVKGIIIALEADKKLNRALSVTNNIEFYRYQVNFSLFKG